MDALRARDVPQGGKEELEFLQGDVVQVQTEALAVADVLQADRQAQAAGGGARRGIPRCRRRGGLLGGGAFSLAIELKGVVNEDSDAGWVRLTLTNDWEACVAEGPDGPVRNGAPFVETVLHAMSDGTEVDLEGTIRGGVRVGANGESALCVVRMELEGWDRADGSSYTRTWGTVCGEDFDEETRTNAAG